MPDPFPLPSPALVDPARGIVLRPWRPNDALVLATAWAVPDIAAQAVVPGVGAVAHAERWIAGAPARRGVGMALDLVVGPLGGDEVWGEVGLTRLRLSSTEGTREEVEIGWWVLPGHRRRGVATAAAGLLARWARRELEVPRLVARIARGSVGSEAVATRIGLRRLAALEADRDLWVGPVGDDGPDGW
ncbi:MAG TPA: GNAT family N-acetyltransferase [Iamia sp.]|nr:GNAT family N-acetyltransferase [Iamia sp.]